MKRSIFTGYLFLGLFCFGLQADGQINPHAIDNLKLNFQDGFSKIDKDELKSIVNDLEVLEEYLKNGLNPNLVIEVPPCCCIQDETITQASSLVTPLSLAIDSENLDAVKLLFKYGASLNEALIDEYELELIVNDLGLLEECLENGLNPNLVIEYEGESLLYAAIEKHYYLSSGSAIEVMRSRTKTFEIMKTLLRAGANPNALVCGGYSPLLRAVEMDYDWMIELLLLAGADPYQLCTMENSYGEKEEKTPFALALEKGNTNIINIFAKYVK